MMARSQQQPRSVMARLVTVLGESVTVTVMARIATAMVWVTVQGSRVALLA